MSIVRKWAIARAEHIDEDGVAWLAESRAGTGTWIIRDDESTPDALRGLMVDFDDEREGTFLALTTEQRQALGLSEETFMEIEMQLRRDYEQRQERKLKGPPR